MSADGKAPDPKRVKRNALAEELAALLDALRALYKQISAKLWHRRLEPLPPSPLAGDSADIIGTLSGHIERTAAEGGTTVGSSGGATAPAEQSIPVANNDRKPAVLHLFSGLFRHLRSKGASLGYQRLGEKMRADTMRHINDALRLARRGDARGAKVHAELAESAMKTASHYLPEKEYRGFRQEVESRLKAVVDGS